jgi:hypothetical protein
MTLQKGTFSVPLLAPTSHLNTNNFVTLLSNYRNLDLLITYDERKELRLLGGREYIEPPKCFFSTLPERDPRGRSEREPKAEIPQLAPKMRGGRNDVKVLFVLCFLAEI